MAKRFIDTLLFTDEWFCELSKDAKLFFLYYITSCDHAGVLRLNNKLCEFQTGIKSCESVIKELGKCLVTVKQGVYFMPKYIKFQYPKFPQSTVKQQESAINILKSYNLWDEENKTYLTLIEELPNTYVNDSVNDSEEYIRVEEKNIVSDIVYFLNKELGTSFTATSKTTKEIINARINEGFTFEDFKKVILTKKANWSNTDMAIYLRPQTLFGNKFESYLNEPIKSSTVTANGVQVEPEYEYHIPELNGWFSRSAYGNAYGYYPTDSTPKRIKQ